jgi:hypothetical protein
MQRNFRPPVLTRINRIGLLHFGQIGGGAFLGMGYSRWIRREHYRTLGHRNAAEDGAAILKSYNESLGGCLSGCSVLTSVSVGALR